ncbi:hypothetical protein BLNAU_21313 [Blattamonas nauphoetae]|uniref:Transmembrane protein n=1 Tax=Blattamonas nauphoetae TaxID=2049346 RepID=A0ABQ9WW86_9EUKA|nr:hypothetical protein BLNAU_21313 [Blattamonas nauphoetae]
MTTFDNSIAEGDGGCLCATGAGAFITASRFERSHSNKHGGGVLYRTVASFFQQSLCLNCSSQKGGASLHLAHGTGHLVMMSSFIAEGVDVSLVFVESDSSSLFSSCLFFVNTPDHDGCDITFQSYPQSLQSIPNFSLHSLTPKDAFCSVTSKLFPSLTFESFFSSTVFPIYISEMGNDSECQLTRLCRTLVGGLNTTMFLNISTLYLLSGNHHSGEIVSSIPNMIISSSSTDTVPTVLLLSHISITNSTFHVPLFSFGVSPSTHLSLDFSGAFVNLLGTCSTSPLILVTQPTQDDDAFYFICDDATFLSDSADTPLIVRFLNKRRLLNMPSRMSLSVIGPLGWCDETNQEVIVREDPPLRVICSPHGEDSLSCGSAISPCKTIQWSVSLSQYKQHTTVTLPHSVQGEGIVLFNRQVKIEGESGDTIISPPLDTPTSFIFSFRSTTAVLSSLIVYLTSSDKGSDLQFLVVQDGSVLKLNELLFFITSVSSFSKPPVFIENSFFHSSYVTTTFNRDLPLAFQSSLISAPSCHQFSLSNCIFDRLSFGEPVVRLTSSQKGDFILSECRFQNIRSHSTCLLRIIFSSPVTLTIESCVFESCSFEEPNPSLIYIKLPSTSIILFNNVAWEDQKTAIILVETDNFSKLINQADIHEIAHLLPTHFQVIKPEGVSCFASALIPPPETVEVTSQSKDSISCMSAGTESCQTLQHVLLCLEDSPFRTKSTEISVNRISDFISQPILISSQVTITSKLQHFSLVLSSSIDMNGSLFFVTGSLHVEKVTFTTDYFCKRSFTVVKAAAGSSVVLQFVTFQWDYIGIHVPLISVESATLTLRSVSFSTCHVTSVPIVSSVLSHVSHEDVSFWNTHLDWAGRLVRLDRCSHFSGVDLTLERTLSTAPSTFELNAENGIIELDGLDVKGAQLFFDDSTVVSITASDSHVILKNVVFTVIIGTGRNMSQLRVSLHDSSFLAMESTFLSSFAGLTCSALTVWTDNPAMLIFNIKLVSPSDYSVFSPALRAIGVDTEIWVDSFTSQIKNRNFLPSAAVWKEDENGKDELLFAKEMVSRESYHVNHEGTDKISCGDQSQPCRTPSYSFLLPHNTNILTITIIEAASLSTSAEMDGFSLSVHGQDKTAILSSGGIQSDKFYTITAQTINVQNLTLKLMGMSVLRMSSFLSAVGGSLNVGCCSIDVTDANWDISILRVDEGSGQIKQVEVTTSTDTLPTIIQAVHSQVTILDVILSSRQITHPLVSLVDVGEKSFLLDGLKLDSIDAVWHCPIIQTDSMLNNPSFSVIHLALSCQSLSGGISLLDLTMQNSTTTISNCSFESIKMVSQTDTTGADLDSNVLRLTLTDSSVKITACSFVMCNCLEGIPRTLVVVNMNNSIVWIEDNDFSRSGATPLFILHPSFYSLIRHSTIKGNTFNYTAGPLIGWNGTQENLQHLMTKYRRTFIVVGVVAGLLLVFLLSIVLVFPFYCFTRICKSHPSVSRFWWRDGGKGVKGENRNPNFGTHIQRLSTQHVYQFYDFDDVDERWGGWTSDRMAQNASPSETSDSEDVLDSVLDDSVLEFE